MNTGIPESKPGLDPQIHSEFLIKDECEDIKTGNLESRTSFKLQFIETSFFVLI